MSISQKLAVSELVEVRGTQGTTSIVSQVKEPEKLTTEEADLHNRVTVMLGNVLYRHGISVTGNELKFSAAEVADFVLAESKKAVTSFSEEMAKAQADAGADVKVDEEKK